MPSPCDAFPDTTMTMFLYALFSVFSAYKASGAPVALDLAVQNEPSSPESSMVQIKRTLFGITWSCLSTTILCAWTAVHPNIPPQSKWQARWNRLELMFWMVVAPELVLAWAVRQFFAAKEIRDAYNNSREGNCGQLLLKSRSLMRGFEQECRSGGNGHWPMATYLAWVALP